MNSVLGTALATVVVLVPLVAVMTAARGPGMAGRAGPDRHEAACRGGSDGCACFGGP